MKTKNIFNSLFFLFTILLSCSNNDEPITEKIIEKNIEINSPKDKNNPSEPRTFKILSLGDSYTIGQGVCSTCSFPEQLKNKLKSEFEANNTFNLNIIATTGWTTTNLIRAIETEKPANDYDLVTLLIGVNNQFQNTSFSIYENEFPQLVNKSIAFAKGQKSNVIVLSIPDYSYTPYGLNTPNSASISSEIDKYNNFAESYCKTNNIEFINITDISRTGLTNSELIADDDLHLSEIAYSRFVNRLLPIALQKLTD